MREQIARAAGSVATRPATTRQVVPRGIDVASPRDPIEQEADRVAQRVVSDVQLEPISARPPADGPGAPLDSPVDHGASLPVGLPGASGGAGRPLDPASRAFFEPRFGLDFSRVRIHADPEASASARSLGARAYTAGAHIVFHDGEYAPQTEAGRRLLAHELTHVVQQSGAASSIVHLKSRNQIARTPLDLPRLASIASWRPAVRSRKREERSASAPREAPQRSRRPPTPRCRSRRRCSGARRPLPRLRRGPHRPWPPRGPDRGLVRPHPVRKRRTVASTAASTAA